MRVIVPLYHQCATPLYQQLADGIRSLIEKGALAPDSKLPSTRELAESLDVSRCTVSLAYNVLTESGYIHSPSHAGTFVARKANKGNNLNVLRQGYGVKTQSEVKLSDQGERLMSNVVLKELDAELFSEINFSGPAREYLPAAGWFKALSKISKSIDKLDNNPDVFGCESLRKALCKYLAATKGINCSVEQIAIFSSTQIALEIFASILINERSGCVVENPGFPGIFRTVLAHNGALRPIEVDLHGLQTERLDGLKDVCLAYVTPNKQSPTGVRMSNCRRKQLLDWAQINDVLVIEDDFDTEYCFTGKPQLSLKAEDSNDLVIYLSSFWAMMYPLTKIGFAVIPEKFIEPVRRAKASMDRHANVIEEEALAEYLNSGGYHRHLRKTKPTIAENRNLLIATLSAVFGPNITLKPSACGTSLVLEFPLNYSHQSIIEGAKELGLPLVSTRSFYIYNGQVRWDQNEFMVSIACLEKEALGLFGELKNKIVFH